MNSTSSDKFILISHIYESANFNSESFNNWAENSRQTWFYQLLWAFRDRIILEVNGHDHISDLRSHSANKMFSHADECVNEFPEYAGQFFAGKLINPGITPTDSQQPGFASFNYNSSTSTLTDLKMTFLQLESTIGLSETATISQMEFFQVDFNNMFGLKEISGEQIGLLNLRLAADLQLAKLFAANKQGFKSMENWDNPRTDFGTIGAYLCLQTQSMYYAELYECVVNNGVIPRCISQLPF